MLLLLLLCCVVLLYNRSMYNRVYKILGNFFPTLAQEVNYMYVETLLKLGNI